MPDFGTQLIAEQGMLPAGHQLMDVLLIFQRSSQQGTDLTSLYQNNPAERNGFRLYSRANAYSWYQLPLLGTGESRYRAAH